METCEYYDECAGANYLPAEQCEICYRCGVAATAAHKPRPFGSTGLPGCKAKLWQKILDIKDQADRKERASGLKRYLGTDLEIISKLADEALELIHG